MTDALNDLCEYKSVLLIKRTNANNPKKIQYLSKDESAMPIKIKYRIKMANIICFDGDISFILFHLAAPIKKANKK